MLAYKHLPPFGAYRKGAGRTAQASVLEGPQLLYSGPMTLSCLVFTTSHTLLELSTKQYTPRKGASQHSCVGPLADLHPPQDHCTCRRLGLRNPKHPKCDEPAPSAPSHCVRTIDRASATNWPRLARKRRRFARSAEAVTPLAPVSAHSAPVSFPRSAGSACPASSRSPARAPAPQHGSWHASHQ